MHNSYALWFLVGQQDQSLTGCGLGNVLELGVIGEGVVGRDAARVCVGECSRPESTVVVQTTELSG